VKPLRRVGETIVRGLEAAVRGQSNLDCSAMTSDELRALIGLTGPVPDYSAMTDEELRDLLVTDDPRACG
jgi:hypothetical protein